MLKEREQGTIKFYLIYDYYKNDSFVQTKKNKNKTLELAMNKTPKFINIIHKAQEIQ